MTNWRFYLQEAEAVEAMREACEGAQRQIDIEMYIFGTDAFASRFADVLMRKARAGVSVRLLADMVGSFALLNSRLERDLARVGVEIAYFNPISPWRIANFTSWYFRDHRKIVVVDGRVGFTGGVNIKSGGPVRRDTQVRLEGQVVSQMQSAFDRMWENARTHSFAPFGKPVATGDGFVFLTHSPHRRQRFLLRELINAIGRAQKYIYLTTPYFVPSVRLTARLRRAARRGVDVRILLPSLSDHTIADIAARSYVGLMHRAGARIYLYSPPYLHGKTVCVDGAWAMVGSLNIDNLSFLYNHEAGVLSTNPGFCEEVAEHFLADLDKSRKLDKNTWPQRPLASKIAEVLTWPIHFLV